MRAGEGHRWCFHSEFACCNDTNAVEKIRWERACDEHNYHGGIRAHKSLFFHESPFDRRLWHETGGVGERDDHVLVNCFGCLERHDGDETES